MQSGLNSFQEKRGPNPLPERIGESSNHTSLLPQPVWCGTLSECILGVSEHGAMPSGENCCSRTPYPDGAEGWVILDGPAWDASANHQVEVWALPGNWQEFLDKHGSVWRDLARARLMHPSESDDTLVVMPANQADFWLLSLARSPTGWRADLVRAPRQPNLDVSFSFNNVPREEQLDILAQVAAKFRNILPPSSAFFSAPPAFRSNTLTIQVAEKELWFLRFPFSVLCRNATPEFPQYMEIEWLVSGKSLTQTYAERAQLRSELSQLATLLRHTVVLINTYPKHAELPGWKDGTELVLQTAQACRGIQIGTEALSLKWHLNPTCDDVIRILQDPDTYYVLADFEAEEGYWQAGAGPRASWEHPLGELSLAQSSAKGLEAIPLTSIGTTLSHIRLLRVFHCNSVFSPYEAGTQPADTGSLARQLIALGAQRVEGGMTEEDYFSFLCSVIDLLIRAPQLRFVLFWKALQQGWDFQGFLSRLNAFLVSHGRDSICA